MGESSVCVCALGADGPGKTTQQSHCIGPSRVSLRLFVASDEPQAHKKKSPAGAERRCRSWCRASWPAQGPSCAPGDPCGAARASQPRRDVGQRGRLLPLTGGILAPASGYGHLTRSRPQDSASNAAAPQCEPRKPLAGARKAPTEAGASCHTIIGRSTMTK